MYKKTTLTAPLVVAALMLSTGTGFAQTASLNLSGGPGLLDMPSGEAMPDGNLSVGYGRFGPISRTTLSFQITPRLSGTFRYVGIRDWNRNIPRKDRTGANAFSTYYDRNFDLRYQLLREGKYLPAVTVGLQDFIGTSLSMGEYVAATKTIVPGLKVTAGLGFGRLGSYRPLGQPLGPRTRIDAGKGGNINASEWFHGNMAAFGGLEYQINDKLSFKLEYSSDAYRAEAANRGTFERVSPINFGVDYHLNQMVSLGLYSMYGSEVGINLAFNLDPGRRPQGGMGGPGPEPILPRPSLAEDPTSRSSVWQSQPDVKQVLIGNLKNNLPRTGIWIESLSLAGDTAQVRFRNTAYDASAQALGRMARAMTHAMPSSIETFELVLVANGVAASKVTIKRSDLESLEFDPDAAAVLKSRVAITDAGKPLADFAANDQAFPYVSWQISPFGQTLLFDPRQPFQSNFGVQLTGRYEIAPGFVLSGALSKSVFNDVKNARKLGVSTLPHVRSDTDDYLRLGDPDLRSLTLAWFSKLSPSVYTRVTFGYMEQMFGGISAEALWKPANSRWALGIEANYVAQRNTDGGLGFDQYNYRIATGHVSGYLDLGKGYNAQLDVGRYLAGDDGATLTIKRTFSTGWAIGAFATLTNVSAEEFGEGSFDKGIILQIPLTWFSGQPSRKKYPYVLRPIGRDGGARLQVSDRLYDTLGSANASGIDSQWGRFWK